MFEGLKTRAEEARADHIAPLLATSSQVAPASRLRYTVLSKTFPVVLPPARMRISMPLSSATTREGPHKAVPVPLMSAVSNCQQTPPSSDPHASGWLDTPFHPPAKRMRFRSGIYAYLTP